MRREMMFLPTLVALSMTLSATPCAAAAPKDENGGFALFAEAGFGYDSNAFRAPRNSYVDYAAIPLGSNPTVVPQSKSGFFVPFKAGVEAGVTRGSRATLAVRPERIRLSHAPPQETLNAFAGVVYESVYIGTDTHYRVRLSPTVSVRIRQQNTVPVGMPALEGPVGVKVWVSWPPENGRVLAE